MTEPVKNSNGNGNSNGSMIPLASAITVFIILLQALSWLAWNTTNISIERIDKRVREVENQFEKRVQIVETVFLRIREHDEYTRRVDSQIAKIEAKLLTVATRDELDTRLGINSASVIQIRSEVDKLKSDLGQTYPMKEVLGNIQSRIDRMEQWSRAAPPHQQKPNN